MSLARAEYLELHHRRGLLAGSLALTVGPVLAALVVLTILHAGNPARHGPAGGVENLAAMLDVLTVLAGVTAILIGATAGAADVGSGVFRDLVATGRSRTALFAARIPGGLMMMLPLVLAARRRGDRLGAARRLGSGARYRHAPALRRLDRCDRHV
jgi:hypothetical protein